MLTLETVKSELRKREAPAVFMPIPAYDWKAEVMFFYSFLASVVNCHCKVNTIGNFQDGIARTRNGFAAHFLKNLKDEYLFFVDSDIVFNCSDFERLLYHAVVGGHPIVGGLYPKKSATLGWVLNVRDKDAKPDPETGLLKCRHVGTGFMLIHRRGFEGIRAKFPEIQYGAPDLKHHDVAWDFFPMGARKGEYESEDYAFCRMAEEAGCDRYVSIHVNDADGKPTGTETFYTGSDDKPLAQRCQTAMLEGLGLRDRGIKQTGEFAVLKFRGPAVLLELGFIGTDAAKITDQTAIARTAALLAKAIASP